MSQRSEHTKIDNARNFLTEKAISLGATKLVSQLNLLCIDLMVEQRIADRKETKP